MPVTSRTTPRELAEPGEAAGRARVVDRSRHDVAVATLAERPVRGDQRSAPEAGLDDDRRVGEAADQAVPLRERVPARRPVREPARRRATPPVATMSVGETAMGPREQAVVAGAEDRDRRPALGGDRGMGRAVDADREARHDDAAGPRDRRCDPRRDEPAALASAGACRRSRTPRPPPGPRGRRERGATGGGSSIARSRAG